VLRQTIKNNVGVAALGIKVFADAVVEGLFAAMEL
jgi:hypothetical protein